MKILVSEEQLRDGVRRMAGEIQKQYEGRPLTLVGVLIGSVVLLGDLIRLLSIPVRAEMVQARNARGNSPRPGPLAIDEDLLSFAVRGRDVLVVDDIFHTGRTLWELIPQIDDLGANSVHSAVLLEKQGQSQVALKPDFVGFQIPDEFVVGYGLDFHDRYRNLPYVAALEPAELAEEPGLVSGCRVVIVTRRFWPLVGGPEKVLANLAVELTARGYPTTVLTARWQPKWPAEILLRGVPVIRLAPPAEHGWRSLRSLRPLIGWLRANRQRYDLLYVSQLKQEAYAAVRAVGRQTPVVLRAERLGPGGDCQWQRDVFCGGRIAGQCRRAAAVIAPGAEIEQELLAAGYSPSLVRVIPNGVPDVPPRTPQTRLAARALLAEANQELQLPDMAPLAVYLGRLEPNCGVERLLEAWAIILQRWPNARLWLIGEGSMRRALARHVEARSLTGRVLVGGVFDEADALLAAADVFLRPTSEPGSGVGLLEAFAAGLPVVASDIPGHREWIKGEQDGLLAPALSASWATAITRLLEDPEFAARLGQAARQKAAAHSLANMAAMHLTLFQELQS